MKKWDLVIIIGLLLLSFLPYIVVKEILPKQVGYCYAEVTVAGDVSMSIPLTGQQSAKEYELKAIEGTNTVRVEEEGISVIASDCRDHVCEDFGKISKVGEIIVCLPHKVYIEVKRSSPLEIEDEIDVRTY